MTFEEYQKESRKTVIYPDSGNNIVYPVLGLVGETGELANKLKKMFRDDGGKMSEERRAAIEGELGDVLWYVSQIATELKISLEDVAEGNIEKLFSRKERGALGGDGDAR